jgi:integrin alpha FG-GAP repeat containing protein 1
MFHYGSTCHHTTNLTVDRDGTIDMVFPVCESVDANGVGHDCSINVAYNKQMGFCTASLGEKEKEACRRPDTLCRPDPNFKFDLSENTEVGFSFSLVPATETY